MLCWSGAFCSLYEEICYADAIFRLLRTNSFARNCLFDLRVRTSPRESHWRIRGLKVRSLHLGFRKTWNNVDMQNSYGKKYVCIKHACCVTRVCIIKCFSYHEKYMFQKISAICEHVPAWFCKVFWHFRQARRKTNDSRRNQFRKRKRPRVLFPHVVALNNEWFVHVASSVSTIFLLSMSEAFIFSITLFLCGTDPSIRKWWRILRAPKWTAIFFIRRESVTWYVETCAGSQKFICFWTGPCAMWKWTTKFMISDDMRWDSDLPHLQSTFSR